MNKKLLIIILGLIAFCNVQAQTKLVEKITKTSESEIVIPYEKYVLSNGLTLIIHEDHSDPIVHVDVTYHVGSAREQIAKSGFAHFFEHMMFQGSDHVADEQHFKIITEAGGTLNGSTNTDRTNYFETVPSNQLEKMLWLESDRMGFLLDAVTQQKFEVQRATVKNERGQNYDNRPYGLVGETLSKNLYPYGHPYSWLTIGYIEDLNRVNVNDLKNFFLRWYGPNNAVLSIGGDVNPKEVISLVEKYFGSIPKCPAVEKVKLAPVVIDKDRYASMVDQYAKIPMLVTAVPGVPAFDKDEVALDCLAKILGGDNNSILYQRLVKTQKALKASASNETDELAGTFQFSIMPKPGTQLSEMEKEIRLAMEEFEKKGVSDDDINKFKASSEARTVYSLESVSGKVSRLASFQTYTGNPNYIVTLLNEYKALTKDDVVRVYNKYLKGKPMVILSVLTKGNENVKAAEDNYTVSQTSYNAPNYGYEGLKYTKAKDNFDRNKMPGSGPNPVIKVPAYTKSQAGDIKMITTKENELPVVVISLGFKGGRMVEQNDLSKAGTAQLFSSMMDEDTKNHTSEEMSVMLDKLGSSINVGTDLDETTVTIRCLKKNMNATLQILEDRLLNPKFLPETFDRIKNQTKESIKNNKTRAAYVSSVAYAKINYGDKNILGIPNTGTTTTLDNISLKDIEDYYSKYFSHNEMSVVVVGDMNEAETKMLQSILKKLPDNKVNLPVLPKALNPKENTAYIVNIPKAAQSEFRVGYVTDLKYDALGEYYKSTLMNFPLGGAFNSRVNLNLREDKGWTYGARSNFSGNEYTGSFTFSSGIKSAATDSALVELVKEFKNFNSSGITAEELSFMKNAIGQSDARKYETGFQKAGFISNILRYNLAADYVDQQNKILNNINKGEIDGLIKKYINKDKMNMVFAGDMAKIGPTIAKLGYKVVELDSEGAEIVKP